jgi:ArsR family transcriptional regulator
MYFFMELKQIEKISKALADLTRLNILSDMSKKDGCIQCSEIISVTKHAQPSVSHHIKTLVDAGLIIAEKDGRNYSYNLNHALLRSYTGWINKIASQ